VLTVLILAPGGVLGIAYGAPAALYRRLRPARVEVSP
jgi:hypothetical protein